MPYSDPQKQRDYFKKYHAERRLSRNEYRRKWRKSNPNYGVQRYNSDPLRFAAEKLKMTRAKQESVAGRKRPTTCEIPGCGNEARIAFDHCHGCTRFRGWICLQCNTAIGNAKENPEVLRAIADYLEAHKCLQ